MKKLLILLTLTILIGNPLVAQKNNSVVRAIRLAYTEIRENINSYDTVKVQIWEESTEGGKATAYYNDRDLKLIEVVWLGEMGENQIEYYFNKGELIFAFEQDFSYNRPIYWDEKRADESGDNETFDSKKTTVTENRYYFHNEKLFLWLDNAKEEVDLTMGTNSIVGKGLIAHCYKVKGKLKK